jgi:hypothetical protein
MAKSKIDPIQVAKWGGVIVGGIVVFRILKGLGVIKSIQEMQQSQLQSQLEVQVVNADLQDWTKPLFWRNPPSGYKFPQLNEQDARDWVKKMYDTMGWFNDDEEAMQGLLYRIKYQSVYSCLADLFQETYNQDMTAWLKNYYSNSELAGPFNYLYTLPTWEKK